ncbi:exopolysaccharide biosynthesis protein [Paenibacillus antri]|uniref:Exopolysaccharide biosynthesis protein n=1 Tax=Paenibacillus antri TaxID=2582848 RepID=A0A5R9GFN4_9BACL|nr:exopolysaccharide biosynthesis protein [Paenibacillus antri]TLS53999.1 exopolysaccharide biosynthesis protein [Paenibacillus antri]
MERNVSDILEEMRHELKRDRRLRVGELLEALRDKGPFFILMVLSVPFLQPIALPGVSTPFGFVLALLAIGILIGQDLPMPGWIRRYALPQRGVSLLFRGAVALFRRLERWSKPRRMPALTASDGALKGHALLMLVSSVLLMLPLPIPFSNSLPAYVVAFVALGYLLRDGALFLLAYVFALLTGAYFALIAVVGIEGLQLLTRKAWGG